jgi:hypothetical protein
VPRAKLVKPCTLRHLVQTTYHSSPNRPDIMVTSLHLRFLSISPTTGAIRTNHGPGSQDKARLTFYAKVPVLTLGQVSYTPVFPCPQQPTRAPWRTYLENPQIPSRQQCCLALPCVEEAQAQSSVIGGARWILTLGCPKISQENRSFFPLKSTKFLNISRLTKRSSTRCWTMEKRKSSQKE